jgi:YVTN family beta-propeller protein
MKTFACAALALARALIPSVVTAAGAAGSGGRTILVVDNSAGNDVTLIDTVTKKAIGSIETGAAPHGLGASPDGTILYVTLEGEDRLQAWDLATATLLWERPVAGRPNELAVSADGRYVYVPVRSSDTVEVFDTQLRQSLKTIQVGPNPHNAYRAPNGKWIYATSMTGASIAIIDIASQSVIGTIPVGGVPRPAAITKDDRTLYVQLSGVHGFAIADVASRKITGRVELPPADVSRVSTYGYTPSHGIALRQDGRQLWITDVYGGHVEGFDVPGHKLIGKVRTGDAPDWLEFSPDGRTLYSGNAGSNDVSVVDTEQMKEIARIPVGKGPKRVVAVTVPRGMGPGEPGWNRVAARPTGSDYYVKGAGLITATTASFADDFRSGKLTAETAPALFRQLGVLGIELDASHVQAFDPASLDRIVAALRREQRTLTALKVARNVVSDDADANQRQIAEIRGLMKAARHLGAPTVVLDIGQTGRGEAADATVGVDRASAALFQLVPLAKQLGLRLAVENGSGPAHAVEGMLRIIQATDPAWVGVCFNFRPWQNADALKAANEKLRAHVFHAHVSCADYDKFGNESSIDYAFNLPALAQGGFGGALAIDYHGKARTPNEGVAQMRDLLVKLWIGKRPTPPVAAGPKLSGAGR